MDRLLIKCLIAGQEVELQFDKKAMPGEAGASFMITEGGCFKGYVTKQKGGGFESLGTQYFSDEDLLEIEQCLERKIAGFGKLPSV